MGNTELEARALRRKGYLQSAVLATLAGTGILAIAVVAPNVLQLLGTFGGVSRLRDQTSSALSRLARKGFVTFEMNRGKRCARITPKGREFLAREMQRRLLAPIQRKRWDRRFRLVMFDIPERRRSVRVRLRRVMRGSGFLRLQDSVWVFPHDCEDFIALLKSDLRVGKDVVYAVVEKIENDAWIRAHFRLPHS